MNDFQIQNKLGEGAYSIVHKVKRNVDGNIYALKRVKLLNLSEKEKLNALNEVRILASVKSNYVISYKEAFYDESENVLGIVMEYADKGDLYQKICEFKKASVAFEESDIWRIFIQIAKGLKALHEMKILHRDLKSANVFLHKDGSAKLGDLNVSKVARRGLGYTQTGTPYYASPEVWKDQPYDSKSDIWSLGCVMYEMITLRPPFRAENMEGLYNKVIKGQYNKISDRYSKDLQEIVRLLLQVQPESRPSCVKRMETFKNPEDFEEMTLLQTIRIPKNLLFLTDKLPQANYEKIPIKKNLSFSNNKNDYNDNKAKIKIKKTVKKTEKNKEYSENKENRDKNYENEEKYAKIDNDYEEEIPSNKRKKREHGSLDNSHLSVGNNNPPNIKVIKNIDNNNIEINNSIVRDKSPKERRIKEINNNNAIHLPNIKNLGSVDDIRSGRNKDEYYKKKKADELKNIARMLPYVNNEHISNIYKILAPPYLKGNMINNQNQGPKYRSNEKGIKNIEKYYEYSNQNYKMKKANNNNTDQNANYHSANLKIIPNRKLSPINNKKMIKI